MMMRSSTPRWHGEHQACVVDDVVELVDEAEVVAVRGVSEEEECDREPERDPDDVLFHSCGISL
jgi:hypothetical protein